MKFILSLTFSILCFFQLNALQKNNNSEIEFTTTDNITINASYLLPKTEAKATLPALILIHQGGSSRQEWFEAPIVNLLIENGYAVLVYDVRLHGKSEKDKGDLYDLFNNPKRAPLDLLAAIKFLKQDKRIDSNRIGIIGASIGANLACVAASSEDYEVKSVVSISAKTEAVQNLSGTKNSLSLKNAFFIASKNEQNGKRDKWANELYDKTTGHKKVVIAKGNKHGSYILRENESLVNEIIEWFNKTL
jgi:dipeptidyl aminopeptidase/acylaminoacyl peptidase